MEFKSSNGLGNIRTECIGFSEIDKYANQLLANKFPNIKNYGDAKKIIPTELPNFDLLVGGFPCQSFSITGKRRGFEDTRGTLFHEIVRILEVKRPRYILLENVKGLLSHDRGRTFAIILTSLSKLGYVIQWMVLNSRFFGVPQNRERVFIIGSLRGESLPEILPFRGSYEQTNKLNQVGQIGEKDNMSQRVYDTEGIAISVRSQGGGQGAKTGLYDVSSMAIRNKNRSKHQNKIGEKYGDYPKEYQIEEQKEGVSYTVKGATQEFMLKEKIRIRKLTPTECLRLQGFPDNWFDGLNLSDTQKYKMMGNAVTVNVIQAITSKILKSMFKDKQIESKLQEITKGDE